MIPRPSFRSRSTVGGQCRCTSSDTPARGPRAFLVRAQDRDHLNFILDTEVDPGLCIAEIYDGPICVELRVPMSEENRSASAPEAADGTSPRYAGSTNGLEALRTPKLAPWEEIGCEMLDALRTSAFPNYARTLDSEADDSDEMLEDVEVDAAALTKALERDEAELDTKLDALNAKPRVRSPIDKALESQFNVSRIDLSSIIRGGERMRAWGNGTDWNPLDEDAMDEPTDPDPITVAYLDERDAVHVMTDQELHMLNEGQSARPDLAGRRLRFAAHYVDEGEPHGDYFVVPFDEHGRPDPGRLNALRRALANPDSTESRFVIAGFRWSPTAAQALKMLRACEVDCTG